MAAKDRGPHAEKIIASATDDPRELRDVLDKRAPIGDVREREGHEVLELARAPKLLGDVIKMSAFHIESMLLVVMAPRQTWSAPARGAPSSRTSCNSPDGWSRRPDHLLVTLQPASAPRYTPRPRCPVRARQHTRPVLPRDQHPPALPGRPGPHLTGRRPGWHHHETSQVRDCGPRWVRHAQCRSSSPRSTAAGASASRPSSKTADVVGWSGLWMRVDDAAKRVPVRRRPVAAAVRGTTGWTRYAVVLVRGDRARGVRRTPRWRGRGVAR